MKFYIASRFADKDKVKAMNAKVIAVGHELIGDWTDHVQIKPYNKDPKRSKEYAVYDFNSAMEADVFVLLTSEVPGAGSSTEFGAALAMSVKFSKPIVYVIGNYIGSNLFNFHPSVRVKKTFEEVLADLK